MVKALIKTKRFLITSLLNIFILLLVGIAFSDQIDKSIEGLRTWNNTDSTYLAFDSREFDDNCYRYYGKGVYFNLSKGDSKRINAEAYQFVQNSEYDRKSIINLENIYKGSFSILKDNEVSISKNTHRKYNLEIGDSIYLFGSSEYKIKFIYENIYDIKHPGINETGDTIFFGSTETALIENYSYAIFDNRTMEYNQIFLFKRAKNEFKKTAMLYFLINLISTLSIELLIIFVYRKSERKLLRNLVISGNKKGYFFVVYILNALITLLPSALAIGVGLLIWDSIISLVQLTASVIVYLANVIYCRISIH